MKSIANVFMKKYCWAIVFFTMLVVMALVPASIEEAHCPTGEGSDLSADGCGDATSFSLLQTYTGVQKVLLPHSIGAFGFPGQLAADAEIPIGGLPLRNVNVILCAIILFMVLVVGAGHMVDTYCPLWSVSKGRPSAALLACLVVSYLILIPGWFSTLMSFNIVIEASGQRLDVEYDKATGEAQAVTESTIGIIQRLSEVSYVGPAIVVLYAIIVPLIKLVMLMFGEYWRFSPDADRVKDARRCITVVQYISKWACPDMFAYILLLYLFRKLNSPPDITTLGNLNVGFVCFSIFCVCSTLSAHALALPGEVKNERTPSFQLLRPIQLRMGMLTVAFAIVMWIGFFRPCLSLRVDAATIVEGIPAEGIMGALMKPLLQHIATGIAQKVTAEVSLWECTVALLSWMTSRGDLTCAFSLLMIAGFLVLLPIFHMGILMLITAMLPSSTEENSEEAQARSQKAALCRRLVKASELLRHTSMLDVGVMGIVVMRYIARMYREKGVIISFESGTLALFLAAAINYMAYNLVCSSLERVEDRIVLDSEPTK